MAAIFAATAGAETILLERTRDGGRKILISGGGRCNVTNTVVTEADFSGGKSTIVRRVLRAFPASAAAGFFRDLGVPLHEEAGGKLFPDSHRARDVLDALLRGALTAGVELSTSARVHAVARTQTGFALDTSAGQHLAHAVVLATGGQSLPKSGSDGRGYAIAQALGHSIVPPTPALAPLLLDPVAPSAIHPGLSGVSLDAGLTVWVDERAAVHLTGALLWTHFGASGPVVLNASRYWARARLEGRAVRLTLSFFPGQSFSDLDARWIRAAAARPRATVRSTLAAELPDALAQAILRVANIDADRVLADFTRDDRRRLVHALVEWPLPVVDTRGYNFAEVTAGGVALDEIDSSTMESRICPGLFLVGEILDVDGRIGGFNFQWSWSSAFVAARALAAVPDLSGSGTSAPGDERD